MVGRSDSYHVAVIDIGKSNAKLVLINRADGQALSVLSRANEILGDGPYPHCDVEGIWAFIVDGLKSLQAEHGVDAISITTHAATAALMVGDELALPVLDYESALPDDLRADYAQVRPAFSETLSANLPGGLNLGAQIFWQSRMFADAFSKVTSILMYPQYWAWKLTGELASEVTYLGCHTDLWNPDAGTYSSLVDVAGWTKLLPPILPAASVIGTITPDIAKQTGLDGATPVACGIHDSNASLLPYLGAVDLPFTIVSSGTWTILMTVGGSTSGLDGERDCLANVDAFGRPVPTARFMGGREYDILMGDSRATPDVLDVAMIISNGVYSVPSFASDVGPFPKSVGRWVGPSQDLSAPHCAAAASLYLALMSEVCLGLVGMGDTIIVEGPLASNLTYCGLLAALTGKKVYRSSDMTGTSAGAAMLLDDVSTDARSLDLGPQVTPMSVDGLREYAVHWRSLISDN